MRQLATIQKIKDIRPIPNADNIEVATVRGWDVVIKKGLYNIGDIIIYCEVDSFLPIREEFEFLRKTSYKQMSDGTEGFRLKTIRMRGQTSQGLILPIENIPEEVLFDMVDESKETDDYLIGEDVSDILGIVKYEPPIPANLSGVAKGYFPSWIRKTDQERIQNLVDEYEDLRKKTWIATEKLDGSSATFYLRDGEFGVCSRNIDLLETDDNTFWKVARDLEIEEKMRECWNSESQINNFAIQGELIGEGVQGNPYKLKGQTVKFFSLFDIDLYTYVEYSDFYQTIKWMNLETVPLVWNDVKLPSRMEELIRIADVESTLNDTVDQEGFVFVNVENGNESFKVISNKFLLNEK